MDVGMLYDMDNSETTILPASDSSTGRTPISSSDNSPSKRRDISTTPRAHLHPMTNPNEPQHDQGLCRRNAHIQPDKQWSHLGEHHLSYHQNMQPRSTSQLCYALGLQYQDQPSYPPVSFPVLQEAFDVDSTPNSPPAEAREDLQWQMYLTASLSNPLNTLELPNPNSSSFSYSTGRQEHHRATIEPVLFPASNTSTFSLYQAPDLFSTPSFVEVPRLPFRISSPHNITASHSHHSFAGICLPQEQEMPREDTNRSAILPNGTYASFLGLGLLEDYDMNSALIVSPFQCQNTAPTMISSPHVCSSPSQCCYQASPLSTTTTGEMISSSHQSKRQRHPPQARHFAIEEDSDGEANNLVNDSNSNEHRPSRPPTPVRPSDPFGLGRGFSLELTRHRLVPPTQIKISRRGKGKAKGSAALALAVVNQLVSKSIQARSRGGGGGDLPRIEHEGFDTRALYQEGRIGIRKRKNNPIPLPIPIPNLNKNSRGRKVPFVADLSADGFRRSAMLSVDSNAKSEVPDEARVQLDNGTMSTGFAQRSSGRAEGLKLVVDDAGCRTYVCVIPGCGKCFIRGEHLKRHVRSLHTHDKPHPCPYEGCNQTFSRRDNLGQHVRIHLQP